MGANVSPFTPPDSPSPTQKLRALTSQGHLKLLHHTHVHAAGFKASLRGRPAPWRDIWLLQNTARALPALRKFQFLISAPARRQLHGAGNATRTPAFKPESCNTPAALGETSAVPQLKLAGQEVIVDRGWFCAAPQAGSTRCCLLCTRFSEQTQAPNNEVN